MNRFAKRLGRLERTSKPAEGSTFTLEELCYAMWRNHKANFRNIARNMGSGFLEMRFEMQDSERNVNARVGR